MVGNDLVDLADRDADSRTFSARFDLRVFTDAERASIRAHTDPARQRWRLWAGKEAAYKVARKLDARTVFAPSRFAVELDQRGSGVARTGRTGTVYRLWLTETASRIHVHAISPGADPAAVVWAWGPVRAGDPSGSARELAIRVLAPRLRAAAGELEVGRADRIPVLWLRGAPASLDLSLSHHGDWVAFAALPRPCRHASAA